MINVAILDDEAVYLDKEKEITEAYFREKQEDCRVDTFQSIEWFVSGLKETCYDLYILDVEMPGKNGLEVSREIRKLYPEPVIIFITNYAIMQLRPMRSILSATFPRVVWRGSCPRPTMRFFQCLWKKTKNIM